MDPRRLKHADGTIYCSEECLRDELHGLADAADPVEKLIRQVSGLKKRIRELEKPVYREEETDQMRKALQMVEETIAQIRKEELTRAIDTTDRGRSLGRCITAIERTVKNYAGFGFYL